MPKVLRIINRFNLGGPTYNVAYLSKFLAPEFETRLVGGEIDRSEGSSQFITEKLGLHPLVIPEMKREVSVGDDRKAYKRIRALIREFNPDIVHTHASKAGALGRLAAHKENVPVIVHTFHGHVFHSYFGKAKTAVFKSVERYLARRSDAIIAISELQKKELSLEHRICPPEKIRVIPLGFDLSRFRENTDEKRRNFRNEYQLADNEVAVGIIGRLVPVKNHVLFLDALKAALGKVNVPVRAFIVGDGEDRLSLEAHARALGFDFATKKSPGKKTLTFTSWITDVDRVLAGIDLVALSSWNEGTPVSLIEAQAAGKPVVSTDVGGIGNVVIPGKTALLSPPGDVAAFSANLISLLNDAQWREEMSAAGWENVGSRFHYTRLVSDMAVLYRDLLAAAKR
jgi:glycosyltransferase involved in cell wall biosynthesis